MRRAVILSTSILILSTSLFAGGYKIPEQSLRSTGTAGAYFSSANAPDSAYFNPANMSFMKGGWGIETGLRYILLPSVKFKGRAVDPATTNVNNVNETSEQESFFIPYFHYVSPEVGKARFGLSFTTPAGLSKRWNGGIPSASAKTFLLEVYEANLSASYRVLDILSVGGGIRGVYARGEVEFAHPQGAYSVSMDGSTSIKPGFYASISVRPLEGLTVSTLYRSKVDLSIDGNASGYMVTGGGTPPPIYAFSTSGSVKIPLPAEWRVGASYKLSKTTLEFTYERTFWSAYKTLDFNFGDSTVENSNFGKPKPKDWKDTNTYRFAVTHQIRDSLTAMAGVAYDETPVPEKTLGFELPDSNGWIFSLGGIYKPEPKVELGLAYLFFKKNDRSVSGAKNVNGIDGKFSNASAHMLTLSLGYSF